ncbi:MAG TPA: 5-(carboxyamino)imidazole ribonucleotide mutase [Bacillota bacterium]|jgi:5-(carboxyamino)imidazole ribonucleotide mutase|nr:5-(carboxyamino)imidazole ribonucleotide mutase [Bacillota bacterium]
MKVAIVMGSKSDLPIMEKAAEILSEFGLDYEMRILSAHRTPEEAGEFARQAKERGFSVIIAGAGLAAHLPGVLASWTTLPVIGVPLSSKALGGLDALASIVQMPPGIPVATVGIDNAQNAALLAIEIMALSDPVLAEQLILYRAKQAAKVMAHDSALTTDA